MTDRVKRFLFWFVRALIALGAVAFFAFCVYNTALLEPEPLQQAYILTLMLCVLGALAFGSGRLSFALVVSGGLFFGLKFISVMKMRYLESPLMPADFIYFARDSLLETLKHYPDLLGWSLSIGIGAPLLICLIWWLDYRPLRLLRRRVAVVVRLVGALACVGAFWICLSPSGPFSPIYSAGLWDTLTGNAHLTNFFESIHELTPQLPAMSDDATAELNWASSAAGLPELEVAPSAHPDIIQVLEESTFDPSNFTDCTIPQCHPQMFQPDQYTRAHGPLRTHTFGGATWVSEFSVLSGMPQNIFGPAGIYAPFVLAPRLRNSLPMLLRRQGYLTVAVYSLGGNFINARNAYRAYGFDKFYDTNDLGLHVWHASDAQIFAATKKVYDENKKPGQPVFIMVLTMQQHGPHDVVPLAELPAPFDHGLLTTLPANQQLNLSAYLSRLQDSDAGIAQLEQDFLHRAQPTVLIHFGDHQPAFGGLIREMPRTLSAELEPYKDYLTYFMLKSNFAGAALPDYPMLDIAYLPSMVLKAAGLPDDPYFSALSSMRTRCHGLYDDCPDKPLLKSYYAWIFNHLGVYE